MYVEVGMRLWWGDCERVKLIERLVPVLFYLPKIPHGITWKRTRRLTHSVIGGPPQISNLHERYIKIYKYPVRTAQ